jgi:hypothetical protein
LKSLEPELHRGPRLCQNVAAPCGSAPLEENVKIKFPNSTGLKLSVLKFRKVLNSFKASSTVNSHEKVYTLKLYF